MMRLVYVAGPFRGADAWQIAQNVRRAEEMALEVWRMGAACVCPHLNTRNFHGVLPDAVWLEGDIAIMSRCDAVLMTPDWTLSSGACEESLAAQKAGIPIFLSVFRLKEWLGAQDIEEQKARLELRAVPSDMSRGVAVTCPNADDSEGHPRHPGIAAMGPNNTLLCKTCRHELLRPTEAEQQQYDKAKADRLAEINACMASNREQAKNTGHGRVTPRPDGYIQVCDGPGICPQCSREQYEQDFARANATVSAAALQSGA